MYNGPLKGQLYSVPSCWINNYPTHMLFIPHPIQSYFKYGIDEVLGHWKDLHWYCWLVFMCWCCWLLFMCWWRWLVFLWVCWHWFCPFWCWNVFAKINVNSGFNNWIGWSHVFIWFIQDFKYFFNFRGECEGQLLALCLMLKPSMIHFKGSHVSLGMLQFWHFHDVFFCEVYSLSCLIFQ